MNTQFLRGILVDPQKCSLSYIDIPVQSDDSLVKRPYRSDTSFYSVLEGLYDAIETDVVELVNIDRQNDLWVDEEGLLKLDEDSRFFSIKLDDRQSSPIVGKGVILGFTATEDGVISTHTTLTIDEARERISFNPFIPL